jgi:hypothetical protein
LEDFHRRSSNLLLALPQSAIMILM